MRYRSRKGKRITEGQWRRERAHVERSINTWGRKAKRALRNRDRSKQPKTRAKWNRQAQQAKTKQRALLEARAKLERQGQAIRKGQRLEVTVTTTYKSRRKLRYIKLILEATREGWTRAQLERLAVNLIKGRRMPKGVRAVLAEWQRGVGKTFDRGKLTGTSGQIADDVRAFLGVLLHGDTKVTSE